MPAEHRIPESLLPKGIDEYQLDRLVKEITQPILDAVDPEILTASELQDREPPRWYMHRIIPEDALVVMYGPPKTGKTFLALEWAHLLTQPGSSWTNYNVDWPCRVLYCIAEGLGHLGERLQALAVARGLEEFSDSLRFLTGPREIYSDGAYRFGLIELVAALIEHQPNVVFIDTLARNTPGADISSNADMQQVIYLLDRLRLAFGCTFILVHHTKKDESDYLGATALYGSADSMIRVMPVSDQALFEVVVETREWDDHIVPYRFGIVPVDRDKPGWATVEPLKSGGLVQERILEWLRENQPVKGSEVGIALDMGKGIYKTLERLESRGLVSQDGNTNEWTVVEPEEVEEL